MIKTSLNKHHIESTKKQVKLLKPANISFISILLYFPFINTFKVRLLTYQL